MELLIEIVGWTGAIEVLVAYILISAHKVNAGNAWYQLLNLTGALFLIVNTFYKQAYPSAFVNIIWAGIAVYSLLKPKKRSVEN